MPLDPSIISSYNPTSGIDVNALMNQRMQGMANINAMERQRQADALALEDRAAAQQKEKSAALVNTLAPAYATAFKGKGTKEAIMAGYNILPPDVQATVKPQIDSLMSMPSDDLRLAALETSLAGSDIGRTLLDRIPTEIQRINADIQLGQLDVSRQDLALRRQKQALDARGEGEWKLQEAEDGFFWTNPRSREVVPADVTGGAVPGAVPGPMPIPAPDAATPGQPTPEMPGVVPPPAGTAQPPAFKPKPKDAKNSEAERTAAYNAGRTLLSAADIFNTVKSDPDAIAPGGLEAAVGLFIDPNFIRSADRQIVSSAQYEAVDALLTLATGAAYNPEQRASQIQRFIPLYSDKTKTREYKKRALLDTIQVAKAKSGSAWTPEMDVALEKLGLIDDTNAAAPPAAPAALPEGATVSNWGPG